MEGFNIIAGEGEIKRFDKQIREALRVIHDSNYVSGGYHLNLSIRDSIEDLGFSSRQSSGWAFIGARQVIKIAYFCSNDFPLLKYRVPTVVLSKVKKKRIKFSDSYHIVIQPRIKPIDQGFTYDTFRGKVPRGSDIHRGNAGIYRGKTVLFDW